jgi:AcrR family transcriptional regulator/DNA-binding MarR family transcriptional regulator
LSSVVAVVSEEGYARMTVARVTGRARLSRRTFYDLFDDREDCFLATFDEAVAKLASEVVPAYGGGGRWRERVRAGLGAFLEALDANPGLASLVVVDALGVGVRVMERRAGVLSVLQAVVDEGRTEVVGGREFSRLTAEGVIGGVFSVIYARVLERSSEPLVELLNELMAMIVLPYEGQAAARRELARPVPRVSKRGEVRQGGFAEVAGEGDPLEGLAMRLTYRTLRVLEVTASRPGGSNREIADGAGISDQGQISKLLGRLERLGLLSNTGEGQPTGSPNAWRLTPRGEEVEHATRAPSEHRDLEMSGTGDTHR